jgi:hypothetical protein
MAVESLYMSHSSASVTCALLELDSLFSIVDDRMVRSGDYYALLQVCAIAALFVAFCTPCARCLKHLQEFMLQAIVFELGNRRNVSSCAVLPCLAFCAR